MSFRALCFDSVALDLNIYNLWLQGTSVQDITRRRLATMHGGGSGNVTSLGQVALQDTYDQCRVFETLRHYLERPHLLSTQSVCQLAVPVQQYMIEKYYRFNDSVIRELIGKKLTTKLRKDMDEVYELTGHSIASCVRQFDNLRRMFGALDDRNFHGNIALQVTRLFNVSAALACRYACIVFLLHNRLNTLAARKRTDFLSLSDLEYFAALMMHNWLVYQGADSARGVSDAPNGLQRGPLWDTNLPAQGCVPKPGRIVEFVKSPIVHPMLGRADSAPESGRSLKPVSVLKGSQHNRGISLGDSSGNGANAGATATSEMEGSMKGEVAKSMGSNAAAAGKNITSGSTSAEDPATSENASSPTKSIPASPPAPPTLPAAPTIVNVWLDTASLDLDSNLTAKWRDIKHYMFSSRHTLEELLNPLPATSHATKAKPTAADQGQTKTMAAPIPVAKPVPIKLKRVIVKALLVIGAGLAQAKELRDFFDDIVDTVIEPLVDAQVTRVSLIRFFSELASWPDRSAKTKKVFGMAWLRFLDVVAPVAVHMLTAYPRRGRGGGSSNTPAMSPLPPAARSITTPLPLSVNDL